MYKETKKCRYFPKAQKLCMKQKEKFIELEKTFRQRK